MASIKSWISAARPRTLFIAAGTAICGGGLAFSVGRFDLLVFILTLSLASTLQLLSNLANDLGDFQKGTDITGGRIGPERTLQSGVITPSEMKKAIFFAAACAALTGILLLYISLQFLNYLHILFLLCVGFFSIWAALKYTTGKNPYGYRGLGDLFTFIFFGPVPVVGSFFLHTQGLSFMPWLPAVGLGFLSAAVLNINNMRDIDNDRNSDKITIPVRLGIAKAKRYHAALISGALLCFIVYNILYIHTWYHSLYLVVFLLFFKMLMDIFRIEENRLLDPYLKYTSMATFLLSVIFVICINL